MRPIPKHPMDKPRERLNPSAGRIVCPQCMETLEREDIEGFGRCPYCDRLFDLDTEIEDFLLSPLVAQWTSLQRALPQADDPRPAP